MDNLRKLCEEYLAFLASDEYHEDNDYDHHIFEAAMKAVFGEGIWDRVHNLMDAQDES